VRVLKLAALHAAVMLALGGAALGLRTLHVTTRKNIPLGYSSVPAVKILQGEFCLVLRWGAAN